MKIRSFLLPKLKNYRYCLYSLFTSLLILLPSTLLALANDKTQPINLEADSADIDDSKGISIYTGNVVLTQGSIVIKSRKLTLYLDKKRELEKAIAEGNKDNLATFKQRPEGKDQDFKARAETMTYYLADDKIHLLKNAHVWQDGDTFSGNKIIYDTKKETVLATSKKDKNGKPVSNGGRIRVTIKPKGQAKGQAK